MLFFFIVVIWQGLIELSGEPQSSLAQLIGQRLKKKREKEEKKNKVESNVTDLFAVMYE